MLENSGKFGEMQGNAGKNREMLGKQGNAGKCWEKQGNAGKNREMQGKTGECGEM